MEHSSKQLKAELILKRNKTSTASTPLGGNASGLGRGEDEAEEPRLWRFTTPEWHCFPFGSQQV
jgi:hypothetical protein